MSHPHPHPEPHPHACAPWDEYKFSLDQRIRRCNEEEAGAMGQMESLKIQLEAIRLQRSRLIGQMEGGDRALELKREEDKRKAAEESAKKESTKEEGLPSNGQTRGHVAEKKGLPAIKGE